MNEPVKPDTRGRLDILAFRMFERTAESHPILKALWDNGGKEAAEWFCSDQLPGHNVLDDLPKPKRRLYEA